MQVEGVFEAPFNPIATAIAEDASFVARAFAGDVEQTKEIIKKAILHKGFSLVDIFQPCVSFNKVNTYQWFKEHVYYLEPSHDPANREMAFKRAIEKDRFPLGIFYLNPMKPVFEESLAGRKPLSAVDPDRKAPLFKSLPDYAKLARLIEARK